MASVWIRARHDEGRRASATASMYRLGGRESTHRYGGSFKTQRLRASRARRGSSGELAALPRPRPRAARRRAVQAADARRGGRQLARVPHRRRRADRATCTAPRSARIFKVAPTLETQRGSTSSTVDDVTALVAALADGRATSARRSARRATRSRMTLDLLRSSRTRRATSASSCRKERKAHIPPPLAEHVERVAETVAARVTCCRCSSSTSAARASTSSRPPQVGDLDEHRRAIRVRWTVEKNERYRHLELPDDLFEALARDAAAARGSRPRRAAVPRPDRRAAADGDHEGVQGDRHAALLAARAAPPARIAALQAHRLARRGRRAARRLEARRGRPLRLRADRLPRGRPDDRARPRQRLHPHPNGMAMHAECRASSRPSPRLPSTRAQAPGGRT